MIRMQAAAGSTVVNFDGATYRVAEDGTIEVPEAAATVLTSHGYVMLNTVEKQVVKLPRGRPKKVVTQEAVNEAEQLEPMES
jgi:hypothetical protein